MGTEKTERDVGVSTLGELDVKIEALEHRLKLLEDNLERETAFQTKRVWGPWWNERPAISVNETLKAVVEYLDISIEKQYSETTTVAVSNKSPQPKHWWFWERK